MVPLLEETPNRGHCRNFLPTKGLISEVSDISTFPTFSTSEEWTTSPQWTNYLVPMCHLRRGSTVAIVQCKSIGET